MSERQRANRLAQRVGFADRPELRRAIGWFLILNAVAIALVAGAAVAWSSVQARTHAIRTATEAARAIAEELITPLCTPSLRRGEQEAVETLDRVVRSRMRDGSITRIKLWSPDGQVLYSDSANLIGRTFLLNDEERALLGTDRSGAEISDLARPEHQDEVPAGRLVEVYLGIVDTQGQPLLFEAYFPAYRLDADARAIAWDFTPTALITIAALQLLQLPLAVALAGRLDRAHRQRGRLLEHAVAASHVERRRIARDLHDSVVQDLAGVGYLLNAVESQLTGEAETLRPAVRRAAGVVQQDVRTLRRAMVEIHPPDLAEVSLAAAIDDLATPMRETGMSCRIRVPDSAGLPPLTVQLLYRAARELLRNVDKHAQASRLEVDLIPDETVLTLKVVDDGLGIQTAEPPVPDGHLGLRLLREAVEETGGSMSFASVPGAGTTVTVVIGGQA